MVTQLEYKRKIASTQSLQKIFNAQELIAASRIAKSRMFAENAKPFSKAITDALALLTSHSKENHPLITSKTNIKNSAILVLGADRGMAGSYTAQILREAMALQEKVKNEGKTPLLYVFGQRAIAYFRFRKETIESSWHGGSDAPDIHLADDISKRIVNDYLSGEIDEVFIVYTSFINMVRQEQRIIRMLPIFVDDIPQDDQIPPLYEFEPSVNAVLDAVLPRYFRSRLHECLLDAAASETASRQRAMHTATENAEDLIKMLVTKSNQARQAKITSELSEIVGSADALDSTEK
jgi:F-type H+-transporting ATPase subunit gamma